MAHKVSGTGFFKDSSLNIFPEHEVIKLDASMPTIQAFSKLVDQNIHSAPVFDPERGEFVGVFDVSDMVLHVLSALHRTSDPDADIPDPNSMPLFQLLTWINRNVPDIAATVANLSERHPFVSVAPETSLLDTLHLFGTKGTKQVGVVDVKTGKILKFITISAVADVLLKNLESLSAFGESTLKSTSMGYRDIVTVSVTSPAVRAFELMEKHKISGIGVMEDGKLVGSLSDSDIRQLVSNEELQIYGLNVKQLLKTIRPKNPFQIIAVPDTAKLVDVFRTLCEKKVRRVYVVHDTDSMKPVGVVTFKELLTHLLSLVKRLDIQ